MKKSNIPAIILALALATPAIAQNQTNHQIKTSENAQFSQLQGTWVGCKNDRDDNESTRRTFTITKEGQNQLKVRIKEEEYKNKNCKGEIDDIENDKFTITLHDKIKLADGNTAFRVISRDNNDDDNDKELFALSPDHKTIYWKDDDDDNQDEDGWSSTLRKSKIASKK